MTEYAMIYDAATGDHISTYSGVEGSAANQVLANGWALMVVPIEAVAIPPNLTAIKAYKQRQIDSEAEVARQNYITPGFGQAMTYMAKNAEALGYLANNAYPTPFLTAEATATGTTVAALALIVRDAAIAWQAAGAAIEAARMGAKAAISSATNLAEIATAATVDWDNL